MIEQEVPRAWIGIRRSLIKPSVFVTIFDRKIEELDYVDWAIIGGYQQPDNGGNNSAQNCVSLDSRSLGMDDSDCSAEFRYFCQYEQSGLVTTDLTVNYNP